MKEFWNFYENGIEDINDEKSKSMLVRVVFPHPVSPMIITTGNFSTA
jgi:hypothetical protein